jgi:phosphoglycerate dehydrogenase-like enzyme
MRVLFCGKTFPEAKHRLAPLLSKAGHELMECMEEEIIHYLDDVDVIIPAIARIGSDLIERGRFGLVQQFGVGLETVDIEAATRFGVWVARVPSSKSGNAESVAEHALLLMLALSRKLNELPQSLEARWVGEPLGVALLHKTACIVGLGNIGTALSLRLHACGMRILAVDDHPERRLSSAADMERIFPLSELPEAVAEADYIVLCINYKASLHNLIDQAVLSSAKPGAMLINVARGGLVNPDALLGALQEGRLAGAGLDVFWEEPVDPQHPLFRQNVIASPHIAGVTDVSYNGTAVVCAENIGRYARGEPLLYAVNAPARPRRAQVLSPVK